MGKQNWLDAHSDGLRDIRALTISVRDETEILRKEVKESKRKADAAWSL